MYKPGSILLMLLLLCFSYSCYDTNNNFGDSLVDTSFRNVVVDTNTVVVTTSKIDSLETSGKSTILLGKYTHSLWGKLISRSYIPYNRPTYSTDGEETVVLDSLVLILSHKGYFAGDTTQSNQFNIHLLTEKIVLNDNGYLYNNSSFAYDPDPIGQYSYKPEPGDTTRFEIRLSDKLGEELLARFHTRDPSVTESEWFEEYFKGIVIIPEEEMCESIIAYSVGDTLGALALRYHLVDDWETEKELLITPYTNTQFNNIRQDCADTILDPSQSEMSSNELQNRGFLMGGAGWLTILEFPHLNNLLHEGERVDIHTAYLKIYPDPGSYGGYNALPDSIYLYITDENNVVTDAVTDYLGEQVQSGVLVEDDVFRENTYYYFDVSTFMQQELGAIGMYKHKLQLVFDATTYTETVKNMTFFDQEGELPIVLQLTLSIYESY